MKIGILIPRSNVFPTLGMHYLNGIRLGWQTTKTTPEWITELIDYGVDPNLIIRKSQDLIYQHNPDLVFCFASNHLFDDLSKFYDAHQIPLIFNNFGAAVLKSDYRSPYVLYNSLNLWFSTWLLGKIISQQNPQSLLISSSFLSAGYPFSAMMQDAFDHNIDISAVHVLPNQGNANHMRTLTDQISATQPQTVTGFYEAHEAQLFINALIENQKTDNAIEQFYVSPFTVTDDIVNYPEQSRLTCVTSWDIKLNNRANQQFITAYHNHYNKTANFEAMLGYESAAFISKSFIEKQSIQTMLDEHSTIKYNSPRGTIGVDWNTNRVIHPHYQRDIYHSDKSTHRDINSIELSREHAEVLANVDESLMYNGWRNPYLCV